jgi:hypothetical protein
MEKNPRTTANRVGAKMAAKTTDWENSEELEIVRCQGKPCKRDNLYVVDADDRVTVNREYYHKGCEPTPD